VVGSTSTSRGRARARTSCSGGRRTLCIRTPNRIVFAFGLQDLAPVFLPEQVRASGPPAADTGSAFGIASVVDIASAVEFALGALAEFLRGNPEYVVDSYDSNHYRTGILTVLKLCYELAVAAGNYMVFHHGIPGYVEDSAACMRFRIDKYSQWRTFVELVELLIGLLYYAHYP
jgi:hypothetical protein